MRKKVLESYLQNKIDNDIKFVEDENGNIIPANKMRKGMNYKCPICKIEMLRYQRGDTIYCARKAGTHHLNPICRKTESGEKKRELPKDKSPFDFIMGMIREKKQSGPGPGPGPGPHPKPRREKELLISNLKQCKESDLYFRDPNEMYGEYRIIDIFLHYWWAQEFFGERIRTDLGPRIVWCAFEFYFSESNEKKLVFRIYCYDKALKKTVFQVKFCVNFRSEEAFRKQLKRVYNYKENPATGKMDPHPMNALIAGIDWKLLSREKCFTCCKKRNKDKCENCYGMFETEFSSEKQIYAWENK